MVKIINLILCSFLMTLALTGCNNLDKDNIAGKEGSNTDIIQKEDIVDKQNVKKITYNDISSKTSEELIKVIETIEKYEPSMSKEERYDLRSSILLGSIQDQTSEFDNCYSALSSIIVDDRYKELFDKKNKRWDAYDDNNLYGIVNIITYISGSVKNQELKNDLNRIKALCTYGLENRDIIALIDARRIVRDIKFHLFDVPYFKDGDEIVEINEDNYSIYYGASEVLEGDTYKTLGIYK